MIDLQTDLRLILAELGEPVTPAKTGTTIQGVPGVATAEDAMEGDSVVAGRTRTLRMATADIPGVEAGQLLNWNARSWRIIRIQLAGMGYVSRVFLGAP